MDDSGIPAEEAVEGAPPVLTGTEQRERRALETIEVNRYLSGQIQQLELMLLQASDLFSLFELILVSLPRYFDLRVAELWMYDPENMLSDMLSGESLFGDHLQLHEDRLAMEELYGQAPAFLTLDATDPRMFEILKTDDGIDYCLLLPLEDAGGLVGSLHIGAPELYLEIGEQEHYQIAHLASVISICLMNAISRHQVNQLTMLDPLTHISNPRGFGADIAREISRSQRLGQPVSLLMMEIDEYGELQQYYGEIRSHFVLKKVAERVSSGLRATDYMARFIGSRMLVLLPGCGEVMGREVSERMRRDIEGFAIDDGRGAILHVSLSLGLVTWERSQFPAVDMPHLATQMQAAAEKGLQRASANGGNCTVISRLSTLLV